MSYKELKKLNRRDLIEILLEQTSRIEELEKELVKTKKELEDRKSSLKEIGSLAEASLVLTDIFKKADETVNVYIKNVQEGMKEEQKSNLKALRELKKKRLAQIDKECEKRIANAEKEISKINNKNKNNLLEVKNEVIKISNNKARRKSKR